MTTRVTAKAVRSAVHAALLIAFLFCPVVSQKAQNTTAPNKAHCEGFNVTVTLVKEVLTTQGTKLYEIAYNYEFRERTSVYIRGLGVVQPRGQFKYLTPDLELEFRAATDGEVITKVPLEITLVTAGSPLSDAPDESDFPADWKSGTWNFPTPYPERVMAVLNKHSTLRVLSIGQVNTYLTRYIPLSGLPQHRFAQVAVVVSHPFDAGSNGFTFRVRYLGRERRSGTDWRPLTEELRPHADQFINSLIAEIQAAGSR